MFPLPLVSLKNVTSFMTVYVTCSKRAWEWAVSHRCCSRVCAFASWPQSVCRRHAPSGTGASTPAGLLPGQLLTTRQNPAPTHQRTLHRMKMQPKEQEKIFGSHMADKGLTSRIRKEILQLHNNNKTTSKNWAKDLHRKDHTHMKRCSIH